MISKNSKVIVLDRDGVINLESDDYIRSPDEWIPIEGSIEAIAALNKNNFRILIATNQSGLARGYFDEYDLANIHSKCCSMVEDSGGFISAIFFCPHLPDAKCACRKPKTGLLKQAETELEISLAGSFFVGDSEKDLETALAFNMAPILVRTGKGHNTESNLNEELRESTAIFDDLKSAVSWILVQ